MPVSASIDSSARMLASRSSLRFAFVNRRRCTTSGLKTSAAAVSRRVRSSTVSAPRRPRSCATDSSSSVASRSFAAISSSAGCASLFSAVDIARQGIWRPWPRIARLRVADGRRDPGYRSRRDPRVARVRRRRRRIRRPRADGLPARPGDRPRAGVRRQGLGRAQHAVRQHDPGRRGARAPGRSRARAAGNGARPLERGRDRPAGECRVVRARRPHRELPVGRDALRGRLQPFLARAHRGARRATSSTSRATRRPASTRARSSRDG